MASEENYQWGLWLPKLNDSLGQRDGVSIGKAGVWEPHLVGCRRATSTELHGRRSRVLSTRKKSQQSRVQASKRSMVTSSQAAGSGEDREEEAGGDSGTDRPGALHTFRSRT